MGNIELKWVKNEDEITLESKDITTKIEIDTQNKEIRNVKNFFRETIFMNFYNDWDKKIELITNDEVEIEEVKTLIEELISICNKELEKVGVDESSD